MCRLDGMSSENNPQLGGQPGLERTSMERGSHVRKEQETDLQGLLGLVKI